MVLEGSYYLYGKYKDFKVETNIENMISYSNCNFLFSKNLVLVFLNVFQSFFTKHTSDFFPCCFLDFFR